MNNTRKTSRQVPAYLQSALRSCPIEHLDPARDKRYIITQALNHGNRRAVAWLLKQYSTLSFKNLLKQPSRGVWLRPVLTFWTTFYGIKLSKKQYEDAIFEPNKIKDRYLKKTKHGQTR